MHCASLVSTALPDAWHGEVHSVFSHALNATCGNNLWTVADATLGGLPNGISLPDVVDFRLFEVRPGAPVVVEDGLLHVKGSRLWVDARFARRWSPVLRTVEPLPAERCAVIRATLRSTLRRRGLRGGFGPILEALVEQWSHARAAPTKNSKVRSLGGICQAQWLPALRVALDTGDQAAIVEATRMLVGRGEGLTPSGDDLLVGLSAALRAREQELAQRFAQAAADLAPGRTTDVATAFHRHAARGEYAERLHTLLDALWQGDDLERAIGEALDWGATSGADTLLGVVLGCGLLTSTTVRSA